MIIPPWAIGLVALAAFGSGWMTHTWKANSDRLAQIQRGIDKAADVSEGLAKKDEETRVVYHTITRDVDKIIDRPVYRDRCLDDDGLQLANAALAGKLNGPVSTPSLIGGRDGSGSPTPDRDGISNVLRVFQ